MSRDNDVIVNPPSAARIMNGLRDTGYDFNTAIADIVDNSIAAGATVVYIYVDADPNMNVIVSVADNGCGMDLAALTNAMRYGSDTRDNPSSLGKFGLGLKTASTAFCRKLSVLSRDAEVSEANMLCWDLDFVAETNSWSLLRLEPTDDDLELLDQAAEAGTGTLVKWEKVDRIFRRHYDKKSSAKGALTRHVNSLRDHIALVYQRFLDPLDERGRNVRIFLNDQEVEPFDPFCTEEEKTELLADISDLEIGPDDAPDDDLALLQLRAYVIPRSDEFATREAALAARLSNENQGFYVYRENRLIYRGWLNMFKIEPHFSLLRVELSFDHRADAYLNVDIKKSRILLDDNLFDYIKNQFLPAPRREAEVRYRQSKKKASSNTSNEPHKTSDTAIDTKAEGIRRSTIVDTDPIKGEATVANKNGTVKGRVVIRTKKENGFTRVNLVDKLDHGELWAPTVLDGQHAVSINKEHDFYQKIYLPLLDNEIAVKGLNFLLWALAESELASYSEANKDFFYDMRYNASRDLEKLVADMPDPDSNELNNPEEF